jgi:folate-binding protein YgfZ
MSEKQSRAKRARDRFMQSAFLPDRGVVRVTGEEAAKFLQGLVTCDVTAIPEGEARFGALLTPQGKIVVDFLVFAAPEGIGGGFLIDAPRALSAEIVADAGAYDAHRIRLGIPEGGRDFIYGDTFPHEADMDQLAGVDFHKGCYVGQEVVSRMQHRGTARTRVIPVAFPDFPPMEGLDVTAGDKTIGVMGSAAEGHGLAKLRLDRVADALAAGEPITAGGIAISPRKPDWARFDWPGEAAAG